VRESAAGIAIHRPQNERHPSRELLHYRQSSFLSRHRFRLRFPFRKLRMQVAAFLSDLLATVHHWHPDV